jgi:hypothetical protein
MMSPRKWKSSVFSLLVLMPLLGISSENNAAALRSIMGFVSQEAYERRLKQITGAAEFPAEPFGPVAPLNERKSDRGLELTRTYIEAEMRKLGFGPAKLEAFILPNGARKDDVEKAAADEFGITFLTDAGLPIKDDYPASEGFEAYEEDRDQWDFDSKPTLKLASSSALERSSLGLNLVFEITGSQNPDEIVTIGAHYDSAYQFVPGANDNGTGVVSVLAIAQALKESGYVPKRTIRLVFFDSEESPYFAAGSRVHFTESTRKKEKHQLFINLDMLGNSEVTNPRLLFHASHGSISEMLKDVNATLNRQYFLEPFNYYVSDNVSAQAQGIPNVSLFENPSDAQGKFTNDYEFYHTENDTYDKVNVPYAVLITQFVAAVAAEASITPKNFSTKKKIQIRSGAMSLLSNFAEPRSELIQDAEEIFKLRQDSRIKGGLCEAALNKQGPV